jgi:hypothetical protein
MPDSATGAGECSASTESSTPESLPPLTLLSRRFCVPGTGVILVATESRKEHVVRDRAEFHNIVLV